MTQVTINISGIQGVYPKCAESRGAVAPRGLPYLIFVFWLGPRTRIALRTINRQEPLFVHKQELCRCIH